MHAAEVVRGEEGRNLQILLDDVVRGGQTDGIKDAERSLRRAGAERLGLVDALGVGNAIDIQIHRGKQHGDQHGVEQISGLFLPDRQRRRVLSAQGVQTYKNQHI